MRKKENPIKEKILADGIKQLGLKADIADNITLELINEVTDSISPDLKIKIVNAAAKFGIAIFEEDMKKMKEESDNLKSESNHFSLFKINNKRIFDIIHEAIKSAKKPISRTEHKPAEVKPDVPVGLTARKAGLPKLDVPAGLTARDLHKTERKVDFEVGSTSRAGPGTVARPGPKSLSLSGKLFAFDFDETILKIHAFKTYKKKYNIPRGGILSKTILENINLDIKETDFADLVFFKRFISYIIDKGGRIAIVSFGIKEIIQLYINKYLNKYSDNIKIYGNKGESDKKNYKNNLLKKAWLNMGDDVDEETLNRTNLEKNNIFFADDDTANIEHALDKATTFQCKDSKKLKAGENWDNLLKENKEIGFTEYTWKEWLKSNNNSKLPIIQAIGPPLVPASGGGKKRKYSRKLKANKK